MEALHYPPHFTFAIYDDIDIEHVRTAVSDVFEGLTPVKIIFDRVNYFDVQPLILWASPRDPAQLLAFHNSIHNNIDPKRCRAHYQPNSWVPHCTLGTRIREDRRRDALAFASDIMPPFEVVFDAADAISFPPIEIVERVKLAQGVQNEIS